MFHVGPRPKSPSPCGLFTPKTSLPFNCRQQLPTSSEPRSRFLKHRVTLIVNFLRVREAVKYDNLEAVARGIDRRRRAYDKLEAAGKIPPIQGFDKSSVADRRRMAQYKFETLEHKDDSFAHEAEVRLILTVAAYNDDTLLIARRSLAEISSCMKIDHHHPDHDRNMLSYVRSILQEQAGKLGLCCEPKFDLPLPTNFITGVTVDPRCPPHKLHFIRAYFENMGVQVSESNCFGHAASKFNVTPRQRVLHRNSR